MLEFLKNLSLTCRNFYANNIAPLWPWSDVIRPKWVLLGIVVILLLLFILICRGIKRRKKRKIKFYVNGDVYYTTKARYKRAIAFPETPVKNGFDFVCWATDKAGKKPYEKTVLNKKRKLDLYAIFQVTKVEEPVEDVKNEEPQVQQEQQEQQACIVQPNTQYVVPQLVVPHYIVPQYVQPQYVQPQYAQPQYIQPQYAPAPAPVAEPAPAPAPAPEAAPAPIEYGPAYYYDEIRYAMLGYERAAQYKKLGVQRKQIVAEMFQKGETVYLYLAIDPELMAKKGFKVEKYQDPQFAIVPCMKEINTKEDFEDALALVNETMNVHNLVKSGATFQRPVSDENSRKSGFAYFVKNENVATTAEEYYRLLRANVLSYQRRDGFKIPEEFDNKMILKIYKKDQLVYAYLALNPKVEGLTNVGFDKNFIDTPAMIEIKSAEEFLKAINLIDKLMYGYGMVKDPNKADLSFADAIGVNCGFGYRVKA